MLGNSDDRSASTELINVGQMAHLMNVEAEALILGALLRNNERLDEIAGIVRPEDFTDPLLAAAFALSLEAGANGRGASPVTIGPMLREAFPDPDPVVILAQLASDPLAGISPTPLARDVAEKAARRRFIQDMLSVVGEAASVGADITTIAADAEALADAVRGRFDHGRQASAGEYGSRLMGSFGKPVKGVVTGLIADFDERLGPMEPGHNIILAGRPGMGKTCLASSIAIAAGNRGHGVLFISLEMDGEELSGRMLADLSCTPEAMVPYVAIRNRNPTQNQLRHIMDAHCRMEKLPLQIADLGAATMGEIRARIRRERRRLEGKGLRLDLVIIDYLTLITPSRAGMSPNEHASEVSRALKTIAKDERLTMLTLAQLNRAVEQRPDHRPVISDLRDSGSIDQDADAVIFVYREAEYRRREEPTDRNSAKWLEWEADMERLRHRLDLDLAKVRGGVPGRVEALFLGEAQAVRDCAFYDGGALG